MKRLNKDEYYLEMAKSASMRSTCLRIHYGAVLVHYDEHGMNDYIISTGYNGAAAGLTQCSDSGRCIRMEMNVPHGYRYELCRSVHAEANAIMKAHPNEANGATLYLCGIDAQTGKMLNYSAPCDMCKRLILNSGIKQIVSYKDGEVIYTDPASWKTDDDKKYAELLMEYSK